MILIAAILHFEFKLFKYKAWQNESSISFSESIMVTTCMVFTLQSWQLKHRLRSILEEGGLFFKLQLFSHRQRSTINSAAISIANFHNYLDFQSLTTKTHLIMSTGLNYSHSLRIPLVRKACLSENYAIIPSVWFYELLIREFLP